MAHGTRDWPPVDARFLARSGSTGQRQRTPNDAAMDGAEGRRGEGREDARVARHVDRDAPFRIPCDSGSNQSVGMAPVYDRAGRTARRPPVATGEEDDAKGCIGTREPFDDFAGIAIDGQSLASQTDWRRTAVRERASRRARGRRRVGVAVRARVRRARAGYGGVHRSHVLSGFGRNGNRRGTRSSPASLCDAVLSRGWSDRSKVMAPKPAGPSDQVRAGHTSRSRSSTPTVCEP